jgi:Na+(H+)/acetate symporter ActP
MFNGLLKIPMQFFILFVGIMLFVFYQFTAPPAFFNTPGLEVAKQTEAKKEIIQIESEFAENHASKKALLEAYGAGETGEESVREIKVLQTRQKALRSDLKSVIAEAAPEVETKDSDYIFLSFVLNYLPHGLIGLLLAVIFSAAMSSTAGELNALAGTTMVDFVQRLTKREFSDKEAVTVSRWLTVIWGLLAIGVALSARLFDNLIQLVNILGSLFYGTILGIFLTAFILKNVKGKAALIGALVGEATVLFIHLGVTQGWFEFGYLMYNFIGCVMVMLVSIIAQTAIGSQSE